MIWALFLLFLGILWNQWILTSKFTGILRIHMDLLYFFILVFSKINKVLKISLFVDNPSFLSFSYISLSWCRVRNWRNPLINFYSNLILVSNLEFHYLGIVYISCIPSLSVSLIKISFFFVKLGLVVSINKCRF